MTTAVTRGHIETVPVHFDDLDAMGILHNARYAVLLERALSAYWARAGFTFAGGVPSYPDVLHTVAEYRITYRKPVRGTGEVGVHFWIEELGRSSAVYGFRFVSGDDGDTVHAEGRRVNVKLDPDTLRPSPWTPAARAVAERLSGDKLSGAALSGDKLSGAA
jgi:acyl-CoA thioester hydrolase